MVVLVAWLLAARLEQAMPVSYAEAESLDCIFLYCVETPGRLVLGVIRTNRKTGVKEEL